MKLNVDDDDDNNNNNNNNCCIVVVDVVVVVVAAAAAAAVGFTLTILELHFDETQGVTVAIPALLPICNVRKYVTQFKHSYFYSV